MLKFKKGKYYSSIDKFIKREINFYNSKSNNNNNNNNNINNNNKCNKANLNKSFNTIKSFNSCSSNTMIIIKNAKTKLWLLLFRQIMAI